MQYIAWAVRQGHTLSLDRPAVGLRDSILLCSQNAPQNAPHGAYVPRTYIGRPRHDNEQSYWPSRLPDGHQFPVPPTGGRCPPATAAVVGGLLPSQFRTPRRTGRAPQRACQRRKKNTRSCASSKAKQAAPTKSRTYVHIYIAGGGGRTPCVTGGDGGEVLLWRAFFRQPPPPPVGRSFHYYNSRITAAAAVSRVPFSFDGRVRVDPVSGRYGATGSMPPAGGSQVLFFALEVLVYNERRIESVNTTNQIWKYLRCDKMAPYAFFQVHYNRSNAPRNMQ